jgi:hypothetical protein
MNTITLNIGLNNNPFSLEQAKQWLSDGYLSKNIHEYKYTPDGIFEDNPEPTLIVRFTTTASFEYLIDILKELDKIFTQQCIAMSWVQMKDGIQTTKETLVYRDEFEGERYEFDRKYFIYWEQVN